MKNLISEISNNVKSAEYVTDSGMRVKIICPENIPEYVRIEKINRIYDIISKKK